MDIDREIAQTMREHEWVDPPAVPDNLFDRSLTAPPRPAARWRLVLVAAAVALLLVGGFLVANQSHQNAGWPPASAPSSSSPATMSTAGGAETSTSLLPGCQAPAYTTPSGSSIGLSGRVVSPHGGEPQLWVTNVGHNTVSGLLLVSDVAYTANGRLLGKSGLLDVYGEFRLEPGQSALLFISDYGLNLGACVPDGGAVDLSIEVQVGQQWYQVANQPSVYGGLGKGLELTAPSIDPSTWPSTVGLYPGSTLHSEPPDTSGH